MIINNKTFHLFCAELRGYIIKNQNGFEIYKHQLFHRGIKTENLLQGRTKFKLELRPE